jgi:hypothetical protein
MRASPPVVPIEAVVVVAADVLCHQTHGRQHWRSACSAPRSTGKIAPGGPPARRLAAGRQEGGGHANWSPCATRAAWTFANGICEDGGKFGRQYAVTIELFGVATRVVYPCDTQTDRARGKCTYVCRGTVQQGCKRLS